MLGVQRSTCSSNLTLAMSHRSVYECSGRLRQVKALMSAKSKEFRFGLSVLHASLYRVS